MDKFREVGVYKNNYVISILDEKIELNSTNLVKNNKISYNDKIYFSIFHDKKNETKKIANFLEPYYDSIENLKSLK